MSVNKTGTGRTASVCLDTFMGSRPIRRTRNGMGQPSLTPAPLLQQAGRRWKIRRILQRGWPEMKDPANQTSPLCPATRSSAFYTPWSSHLHATACDRTTLKMRGLSPKIISGDSRRSENAQTHTNKHTISNMKFKLKLLQIKCHVLCFIKDKAQNMLQELIRVLRKRSSLTIGTRSSP
jgi:hypothetical protein